MRSHSATQPNSPATHPSGGADSSSQAVSPAGESPAVGGSAKKRSLLGGRKNQLPAPTTLVEDPEADLRRRCSEAETAETPLRQRVSELEQHLEAALARADFATAETAKTNLDGARWELAVASATTGGLRGALDAFVRQRAVDSDAIQQQRTRDQARATATEAARAEQAAIEELQQLVASVHPGRLGTLRWPEATHGGRSKALIPDQER